MRANDKQPVLFFSLIMPRSSRSSRPAARPARPSGPSHQQTRSAHTHAPPPQQHAPVQQQQRQPSEAAQHRQPGLFGQSK